MILIVVKFKTRPEHRDDWLARVDEFTRATRAEDGNLWFDWSRSVDDPNEFVLVEAFRDAAAGEAHVRSEHFAKGLETMRGALADHQRRSPRHGMGPDGRAGDHLSGRAARPGRRRRQRVGGPVDVRPALRCRRTDPPDHGRTWTLTGRRSPHRVPRWIRLPSRNRTR